MALGKTLLGISALAFAVTATAPERIPLERTIEFAPAVSPASIAENVDLAAYQTEMFRIVSPLVFLRGEGAFDPRYDLVLIDVETAQVRPVAQNLPIEGLTYADLDAMDMEKLLAAFPEPARWSTRGDLMYETAGTIVVSDSSGFVKSRVLGDAWLQPWSPGAESFVYTRDGQLRIRSGTTERVVSGDASQPAWSATNKIAFVHGRDNAHLAVYDATSRRTLMTELHGHSPLWSPDGAWLAYLVPGERGDDLFIADSSFTARPVALGVSGVPEWAPDSSNIAVLRYYSGEQGPFAAADVYATDGTLAERIILAEGEGNAVATLDWQSALSYEVIHYDLERLREVQAELKTANIFTIPRIMEKARRVLTADIYVLR